MCLVFGDSFKTSLLSLVMALSVRVLQECFFVLTKMREASRSEKNLITMVKIKDRNQNLKSFDKM